MNNLMLFASPLIVFLVAAILMYIIYRSHARFESSGFGWPVILWLGIFLGGVVWSSLLLSDWMDVTNNKRGALLLLGLVFLALAVATTFSTAHWSRRVKKNWLPEILQLWLGVGNAMVAAVAAGKVITTFGSGAVNTFIGFIIYVGVLCLSIYLIVEIDEKVNPNKAVFGVD